MMNPVHLLVVPLLTRVRDDILANGKDCTNIVEGQYRMQSGERENVQTQVIMVVN